MTRDRSDRCPGVLRPWIAEDGALIRLRLVGGEMRTRQLERLVDISARWADGDIRLTKRANLQLRGIEHTDGCVPTGLVDELTAAGFLPHPSHELVRNIMTSALTGRSGGRADLRPVAHALDAALVAAPELAQLPGRFLFVLDDGRGDVAGRSLDLGAFVVDGESAQLRIGSQRWGPIVPLDEIAPRLIDLAHRFLAVRGNQWHVDELDVPLTQAHARDLRTHLTSLRPPFDDSHIEVPDGLLTPALSSGILGRAHECLIVTAWRSVILP